MMESVPGSEAAAPTPINTRAPISTSGFGASAPSNEPAAKIPRPPSISRLRPNRSDNDPASNIKLAKVSAYPLTTHCNCVTPAWSVDCTLASATLTTVISKNVRNKTAQTATSARRRDPPERAFESADVTCSGIT
jgi:hypothetical protein